MSRPPNNRPPVSFKTIPGRNPTQKWAVAKQYDYSGDDWGGYDAYEDYSGGDGREASSSQLSNAQQLPSQKSRQHSFDQGEERRQFSAGPVLYGGFPADDNRGISPARSAVSAVSGTSSGGRKSNDYPRPPRTFTNPEQMPPPLNTRASPSPGPATASPGGAAFPPRKSSVSSGSSPAPPSAPPSALPDVKKEEKELPTIPFIRPSDIYKRMEAEREKERQNSLDSSSRAPLDNLQPDADAGNAWQQRPLSAVEEGPDSSPVEQQKMQVPPGFGEPREAGAALPPVTGVSSFGNNWFAGSNTGSEHAAPTASLVQQSATPTTSNSLKATHINEAPLVSDTISSPTGEQTHDISSSPAAPAPDALTHQPSQGYRSVVNRAFDHGADSNSTPATPITRDNSQSMSEMSRSNTTSTGNISPIMSRVPVTFPRQEPAPAPIVEQPSPSTTAREHSTSASVAGAGAIAAGAAAVGVAAGYRRSLDPPSPGNSPARTPGVESSSSRRLSEGLTAENMTAEAPAVPDQGVEMHPTLQPAETPASEISEPRALPEMSDSVLPVRTGRPRAGTDYSMRESDLAEAVNSAGASPNLGLEPTMSKEEAAHAERAEQKLFLQMHGTDTNTPISRTASPLTAGGTNVSPAPKSRVREIADKYAEIHEASRRNSQASGGMTPLSTKSSWSRFGSEENLSRGVPPKRQGTGTSNLVSESDYSAFDKEGQDNSFPRPEIPRADTEQSFRPHLPGEWVSFQSSAPSESRELSPARPGQASLGVLSAEPEKIDTTPRASTLPPQQQEDEPIDLTPTTRKISLQGTHNPQSDITRFGQVKDAGSAMGAAIMAQVGLGHQTRDFGSSKPAQPVDQPETQFKPPTGELGFLDPPRRPELTRGDTGATDVTAVTDIETPSVASDGPPTPPAKNTPPVGAQSVGTPSQHQRDGSENYFSVAPLRMQRRSGEGLPEVLNAPSTGERPLSGISPALSVYQRPGDSESDRLRKEIVRTLDNTRIAEEEDAERTQDALDAPDNARRIEAGVDAQLPAEMSGESAAPSMLMKRFSFEKDDGGFRGAFASSSENELPALPPPTTAVAPPTPPVVREPEPSPEIKPERPYERPTNRGLHVMNAADSSDDEEPASQVGLSPAGTGLGVASSPIAGVVSPITRSEENLDAGDGQRVGSGDANSALSAPSPMSEGTDSLRLPSYYLQDSTALGLDRTPSREDTTATQIRDMSDTTQTTVQDGPPPLDEVPPQPVSQDVSMSPTSPTTGKKPPPFREILAIKSPTDRIRTYDETRQTFADMDTGLSNWLNTMLINHPEHANLATPGGYKDAASNIGSIKSAHKSSPSLAKFTKSFNIPGTSSHTNAPQPGVQGDYQPGAEPVPPKTPSKEAVDMERLQQRGKDLMKGAGALSGKAQAGAKGLFAKGRRQLGSMRENSKGGGGSKDLSSSSNALSQISANSSLSRHISAPMSARNIPLHQPKPVHGRSTSEHISATNSRASTPMQLSRTHTPSSISSAGGAISRTLSRLRDRSRSHSRKGSRPSSMVLVNSSDLASVIDASPGGEFGPSADPRESMTSEQLSSISPWDEPGVRNLDEELERNSGVPDRLGVLPSPTQTTFSRHPDSPPRTAVPVSDEATQNWQSYFDTATRNDPKDETELLPPVKRTVADAEPAAPTSPETGAHAQDGGDEGEEDLYTSTPISSRLDVSNTKKEGEGMDTTVAAIAPVEYSKEVDPQTSKILPAFAEPSSELDGTLDNDATKAVEILPSQGVDVNDQLDESTPVTPNILPSATEERDERISVASGAHLDRDIASSAGQFESPTTAFADLETQLRDAPLDDGTPTDTQGEHESRVPDVTPESEGDKLYESTAKAVESQWIAGGSEAADEDELYETTPATAQKHWRDSAKEIAIIPADEDTTIFSADEEIKDIGLGSISNPLMLQAERERLLGTKRLDDYYLQPQPETPAGGDAASSVYSGLDGDEFEKASDVSPALQPEGAGAHEYDLPSRRSSVSTLGQEKAEQRTDKITEPDGTARAIEGGPVTLVTPAMFSQDQQFMNRSYHTSPEQPRPLSWEPRERDSSGALVQESLDIALPSQSASDASNPHQRQSPIATALTRHRKQPSGSGDDPKAKRHSGFFRERAPPVRTPPVTSPPATTPPTPTRPSASAISDHYGLEDLPIDPVDLIVDEDTQEAEEQPRRRKSGIWETFRRTPATSRENILQEVSGSRGKVLQKPQRSSTTAATTVVQPARSSTTSATIAAQTTARSATQPPTQPEQQKKRFSGFGSLFGRSSTTGYKAEKPKKLSKAHPKPQRQSAPPGSATQNLTAYESQRRQQTTTVPAPQDSIYPPPTVNPPPPYEPRAAPPAVDHNEVVTPPPGGWYGPGHSSTAPEATSAAPSPNFPFLLEEDNKKPPTQQLSRQRGSPRPLSEEDNKKPPTQQLSRPRANPQGQSIQPEGSRPSRGSFSRPFAPSGQPEVYRPTGMKSQPSNTPTFSSQWNPERQTPSEQGMLQRNPSEDYPLSPQISGQSEWQRSDWYPRGSSSSISPIQSRTNSDMLISGRTRTMGSISEEVTQPRARMPSMDEGSRNFLPPLSGNYGRRKSSDATRAEVYGYGYDHDLGRGPYGFAATSRSSIPSLPPQLPPLPTSETLMAHAPIAGESYSSGFMSAESDAFLTGAVSSPQQRRNSAGQRLSQAQSYQDPRGFNGSLLPPQPVASYVPRRQFSGNAQVSGQRQSALYIGRRDDPSASEEHLDMMGVSYPGQEWSPEGWAH